MARRSFAGKTVVITGGAGGLGLALARAAGAAGARVALLDLPGPRLDDATAQLCAAGVHTLAVSCDVTELEQCMAAMAQVRAVLGGVDVLVNNAGVPHRSLFANTAPAVIRKVMAVNFDGAVHCTHAALPDLVARRGLICTISSVAGFAPLIGRTGYAASKHALHGFFDSLRTELAPQGVHVLLVCPSFVATGIDSRALAGDGSTLTHTKPLQGAPAQPDAVARAIVQAACAGRELLLPGMQARLAWWVSRLAPRRYARLMLKNQAAEFGRR